MSNVGVQMVLSRWAMAVGQQVRLLQTKSHFHLTGIVPKEISAGHWHTCVVLKPTRCIVGVMERSSKVDGSSHNNPTPEKPGHFSGTNPVKAHGEVTSWAIHPALPTGLNLVQLMELCMEGQPPL